MPLFYGTARDQHVSDMLMCLMPHFEQSWVAVIRSIDSTRSLEGLAGALTFHCVAHKVVQGNVCLSMSDLQQAVDAEVFTGFDEVWVVSGTPPVFGLNEIPPVTSDATEFLKGIPDGLVEAVERANCVLILGDGCGLNYLTSDARLHEEIRKQKGKGIA